MKLRLSSLSLKRYLATLAALATVTLASAGQFYETVGYTTYQDFAANKAQFRAGNTDVIIFDIYGEEIGELPLVPNFGAMVDVNSNTQISAALVGKQNWLSTAGHVTSPVGKNVTFTTANGATSGSAYFDEYRVIDHYIAGEGTKVLGDTVDYAVSRLAKIVTDAVAWDYCTDSSYAGNNSTLQDALIIRVGGGRQIQINENGSTTLVSSSYEVLTAGMLDLISTSKFQSTTTYDPTGMGASYDFYYYGMNQPILGSDNPLSIGSLEGDSGSPLIVYNKNTEKWEYLGAVSMSICNKDGPELLVTYYSSNAWAQAVQDSTKTVISSLNGADWTITNTNGTLYMNNGNGQIVSQGLANNLRGYTSTSGNLASDAALAATKDWFFSDGGANIMINTQIDTGAGVIYFNRGGADFLNGVTTEFTISGSRLNTAGYSIENGVKVTSTLTGTIGDEWRVVGQGGVLEIKGSGTNNADLNIGLGVEVILNRMGGQAINNVKINTGAMLTLGSVNQIGGSVSFGVGGGTLNLNGEDLTRANSNMNVLDESALIANYGSGTTSTFTYSGSTTYLGGFSDGTALGKGNTGILNLNYTGSSIWSLRGYSDFSGTFTVSNGGIIVEGDHLRSSDGSYSGYWNEAYLAAGSVKLTSGTSFTIGEHAAVKANMVVNANSSFFIGASSSYSGTVALSGTASIAANNSVSGAFQVTGGTLQLTDISRLAANLSFSENSTLNLNFDTLAIGSGIDLAGHTFTATGNNTINITSNSIINAGSHKLFESGGLDVSGATWTLGGAVANNGDSRQSYSITSDSHNLYLTVSGQTAELKWNSSSSSDRWELKNGSSPWSGSADADNQFYTNDAVEFTSAASNKNVVVKGVVVAREVLFSGGDYSLSRDSSGGFISGASSIRVTGGSLTLGMVNSYTGGTYVEGGTLNVSTSGSLGAGKLYVSGGTANINCEYANLDVILSNSGHLLLNNGRINVLTMDGGTLNTIGTSQDNSINLLSIAKGKTGSFTGYGSFFGQINVMGTMMLAGVGQFNANVFFGAGSALGFQAGTINIYRPLSVGSNTSLTVMGGGILNNSADVFVGGTLMLGDGSFILGGGNILTLNGGEFKSNSTQDRTFASTVLVRQATLGGTGENSGTLKLLATVTHSDSNILSIGGNVEINTLILQNSSATTVSIESNSTLQVNTLNASVPSLIVNGNNSNLSVNDGLGGTLSFTGWVTDRAITVTNGGAVGFYVAEGQNSSASKEVTVSGNHGYINKQGAGELTYSGSLVNNGSATMGVVVEGGTLTLSGNNSYTGNTIIKAGGTLKMGSDTALGGATGQIYLQGGTLDFMNRSTSHTINYTGGSIKDYANYSGRMNVQTSGLTLSNDYTGGLNVDSFVRVVLEGALPTANLSSSLFTLSDISGRGLFHFDLTGTAAAGTYQLLTRTGGDAWDANQFSVSLTGLENFTTSWIVTGDSVSLKVQAILESLTWSGSTWNTTSDNLAWNNNSKAFINESDVTFDGGGSSIVNITTNVAANKITVSGEQDYSFIGAGSITEGSLLKEGSGTLTINTSNSYAGGTTISGGQISINNARALGSGNIVLDGGTLATTNDLDLSNMSISITSGKQARFETAYNTTLTVNQEMLRDVIKTGTGTLSATGATGTYKMLNAQAGTIQLSTTGTGSFTVEGLSGAGNIELSSLNGASKLNGENTSFTGTLTINAGFGSSFALGSSSALGSGTANLNGLFHFDNNAARSLEDACATHINLASSSSIFAFNGTSGESYYLKGDFSGSGRIFSAAGTNFNADVYLSGSFKNFTGSLTSNQNGASTHRWIFGNDSTSGNIFGASANLISNASHTSGRTQYVFNYSQDVTLNATIGASGAQNSRIELVKQGENTLTIAQANAYFLGTTSVEEGTLRVTNSNGLGYSAVSVSEGATLSLVGAASQSGTLFSLTSLNNNGSLYFDLTGTNWDEGAYSLLSTTGTLGDYSWNEGTLGNAYDWAWDTTTAGQLKLIISLADMGHITRDKTAENNIDYHTIDAEKTLSVGSGITATLENTAEGKSSTINGEVAASAGGTILVGESGATVSSTGSILASGGSNGTITLHTGTVESGTQLESNTDSNKGANLSNFAGSAHILTQGNDNSIENSSLTSNIVQIDSSSDLLLKNVIVGAGTNINIANDAELTLAGDITIAGGSSRAGGQTFSLEESEPSVHIEFKVGSGDAVGFTAGESLELVLDFNTIVGEDWANLLTYLQGNPNKEVDFSFEILGLEHQENINIGHISVSDYIITIGEQGTWQEGIMHGSIMYIPEPSTVTLSLLALAGLAARRRKA